MLMTSHSGSGVISISVDVTPNLQRLIVDFISSELCTKKEINLAIKNLVIQKDFKSILRVEQVEPYLKIAKILSNKLGWQLEFDFHQDYKFRLSIPINHPLSAPTNDEMSDDGTKSIGASVKSMLFRQAPPGSSQR
jgi:hypothetical protein